MALDRDPNYVFRDFVTDGIPASGKWDPRKPEIRQLLSEWWQVLIALIAGAGGDIDLPNLLIRYTVTGGTPNAITATPNLPVPSGPGLALFSIQIQQTNTGPVTINGKPLLTSSGNQLTAGGLVAGGMYLFLDNGSSFRLLTDQASAALVAQMETLLNDMKRRYLGSFADNAAATAAGGTPSSGQLYWNTTSSEMRIWNGSAWQAFAAVVADRAITLPKLGDVSFSSFRQWGFETSVESWTAINGTISAAGGVLTLVTGSDPQLNSPMLSIPGALFSKIRMRVRRSAGSGTWDGTIYYSTSGHGFSGSYSKKIAEPSDLSQWQVLEWDMADLTQGGNDWITSTITRFRIDLSQIGVNTFEIDWIAIGDRALALPKSSGPLHLSVIGDTQAALDTAHALADDIIIDRPVAITSTATWPSGKNYLFVNGGQLDIANGVTLTIRGQVSAGVWKGLPSSAPRKIFNTTGTGKVVGLRYTRPEWWGALRNGTSDDAPAFNAAQQCMEESMSSDGEICFELSAGSYGLGRSVKSTVKSNYRPVWRGQGSTGATMLIALASFTTANGTAAIQLGGGASEITFDGCHIAGFRVVPEAGTSASIGVLIGGSAAPIHAGSHNAGIFEDVNVYDFDTCWKVKNARLFTLRKVGGWVQTNDNAYALEIEAINGETTADLEIENCQFVASATGATSMRINGFGTNSLLTGIRLPGTIFYNGGITISSSSGARVCDVWFDGGWQLDVFRAPIQIACDGATSQLYNLNFNNGYFAGALSGNVMAFNIFTANSGRVRAVRVRGNTFVNTQGDVVFTNGNVQGVFVEDNVFIDAEGGNLITIGSGVSGAIVTGNVIARHFRTVTAGALVATVSGANYYAIRNNMTNGLAAAAVNDAAVGAQRIVDGNL